MTTSETDRAWELMEKIPVCVLTTWDGRALRSRPMRAHVSREENCVYFLTDVTRQKDDQIHEHPQVSMAFTEPGSHKYVSAAAHAVVSNDREKIKELFTTPAKAWWTSADHPNIRVLKVTPIEAEYWDGPGGVVNCVKMAVAAITKSRPDLADNKKVSMA
jgi:general stress protein 26